MILVCLGATLIMVVSSRLPNPYVMDAAQQAIIRVDPGRIAAGVVTGVGFLGAGVVIKLRDLIRGVTTAATIWFGAALGIVIGQGHYGLAVAGTVMALIVLWFFNYFERWISSPVYREVGVVVDSEHSDSVIEFTRKRLEESNTRLMDIGLKRDVAAATTEVSFHVRTREALQGPDVTAELCKQQGVRAACWK